jgi:hypothetical protein
MKTVLTHGYPEIHSRQAVLSPTRLGNAKEKVKAAAISDGGVQPNNQIHVRNFPSYLLNKAI